MFVLELPGAGRPRKSSVARVPRVVAFLEQAVEFQRLLGTREVRFRAGLAARSGVSAMRVTQILGLTKLAPEVQDYVRSLPPGTPERRVTERSLRVLTTMAPEEQVVHASKHVPGFTAFLVRRKAGAPVTSGGARSAS